MMIVLFGLHRVRIALIWKRRREGVNETADECLCACVCVCGWSREKESTASAEVVGCWWKWTVKGRRSSLNEITICRYEETARGEENKCPVETSRGAADGPGCLPLQSSSFTPGNLRGSPVAPNKLSIEFNSWTSEARPEKQEGPESENPFLTAVCLLNLSRAAVIAW